MLSCSSPIAHSHWPTWLVESFEIWASYLLIIFHFTDAFGVTEAYMDQELCRFIASGRLHAKIDKVYFLVEPIMMKYFLPGWGDCDHQPT